MRVQIAELSGERGEGVRREKGQQRKVRRKGQPLGSTSDVLLPTQKPTVDKEPCGKRAESGREEWSSRPLGNSENVFFSDSNRYGLPAQGPCFTSYPIECYCLLADEHI